MLSFSLASPTRAKHALKASLPFSASPSAAGTASSMKGSHRRSVSATLQTSPATRDNVTHHNYHTLAGPLFSPNSNRSPRPNCSSVFARHGKDSPSAGFAPSSPRAAHFQSYTTETHSPLLEEIASIVAQNPITIPPSPLLASPKVHLKSCLKSPMIKSPHPDMIKSPRFVSNATVIDQVNDTASWRKLNDLEDSMSELVLERGEKNRFVTLEQDDEEGWKKCTERPPTPFKDVARSEWLETRAGLSGRQASSDIDF
ncbi:hypothetical protein FRC17_000449 [Serendipita sp. 399]|nr:hypothetical protein FRC17_000449 [Serendipita sp. 399]